MGGGHAHLHLVKHADRLRLAGARIALIDPGDFWYSGLATGMLGGQYRVDEDRVALAPLCRRYGVELIPDEVVGLRPAARELLLRSGHRVPYHTISFNIGSQVLMEELPGADRHAWPVKPITRLRDLRLAVERRLGKPGPPARCVVVGGGASGCEIAANLVALARRTGREIAVTIVEREGNLLREAPPGAAARLRRYLERRGVGIELGREVERVSENRVFTARGALPADFTVLATGLRPPRLLAKLGLPLGKDGGLLVRPSLQAVGRDEVFGAGDCICFGHQPLPRLGVFAVREAPVLLENLVALLEGRDLRPYTPQPRYLSILNLGNGKALATWGPFWWLGGASLWLKDRLDRRFLNRFRPPRRP